MPALTILLEVLVVYPVYNLGIRFIHNMRIFTYVAIIKCCNFDRISNI